MVDAHADVHEETEMIDVVESFSCPAQTEAYIKAFQGWRRREGCPYAYRFHKNPKETTFSDGRAVGADTPALAQSSALRALGGLFGSVLLLYLLLENVLDKVLVLLANVLGYRVEILYWGDTRLYGDLRAVFLIAAGVDIVKYLIPALVLALFLKLPREVRFPLPVSHPQRLLDGIGLMMLLSVGFGTFFVSQSAEMSKYRMIADAVGAEDHRIILFILFSVFVQPFAAELLLHGSMFQVLRQFGDRFTVCTTAVLSACLAHNVQDAVRIGVVTFLISAYVVTTGSVISAILLRVTHEIYMFALFYIGNFGQLHSVLWWIAVVTPVLIFSVTAVLYLHRHEGRIRMPSKDTDGMSVMEQSAVFYTTLPMTVYLIVSVLFMIVTVILAS